jgi:hypothetical protein
MMPFFIVWTLALLSFYAYRTLKQRLQVTKRALLLHFVLTAVVAVSASPEANNTLRTVFHPQDAFARYYVTVGYHPPWLTLLLRVAMTILGSVVWTESFGLAAGRPNARRVFLRFWPFLLGAWFLQYTAIVQARSTGGSPWSVVWLYTSGVLFYVGLGAAIQLHFRSTRSDAFFSCVQAA